MSDERTIPSRQPAERKPSPNRSIAGEPQPGDLQVDYALRPRSLHEMIGQERLRDKMQILVDAARQRGDALDHVLLYGPPGLGKCITAQSLVVTGQGLVPLGDLLPADLEVNRYRERVIDVFGLQGLESTSHVYANGVGPVLRVRTRSGFEIEGTPNHPLLVATDAGPQWKQLDRLTPHDFVAIARGTEIWGDATTGNEQEDYFERQQFGRSQWEIAPAVRRYGKQTVQPGPSRSLGRAMLALGAEPVMAEQDFAPLAVLQGPRAVAIAFLRGLFASDGSVGSDGCVELGARSQTLASQVQLLLANLGIIAHRTQRQCSEGSLWNLSIGGQDAVRFHEIFGFRLPRQRLCAENSEWRVASGDCWQHHFRCYRCRKHGACSEKPTANPRGWNQSDLVPGANSLLRSLLDRSRSRALAFDKLLEPVTRGDLPSTRRQIQRYLTVLPDWLLQEADFAPLASLMNPLIHWDQVATIEQSTAETFDFVVPNTHSFVANGFFNHNTTLAHILAHEMGGNLKVTAGPAVEKAGDLAAILTNLRKGDILFIDEIHRLGRAVEEILYPAMEDFSLNIIVGSGPGARNIQLSLPKFTVVGATTRLALLTSPLRARFGVVERFDFYDKAAIHEIVLRAATLLKVPIDPEGAQAIAHRARGTPRVALRLLRRLRDYAQVRANGHIDARVAAAALSLLEIDELGLDDLDRRVLDALIHKFRGGPVGLDTLAASISEEPDTIMDVVEPYLLQLGFLDRTPRGRVPTRAAYAHMKAPYPESPEQSGLFG